MQGNKPSCCWQMFYDHPSHETLEWTASVTEDVYIFLNPFTFSAAVNLNHRSTQKAFCPNRISCEVKHFPCQGWKVSWPSCHSHTMLSIVLAPKLGGINPCLDICLLPQQLLGMSFMAEEAQLCGWCRPWWTLSSKASKCFTQLKFSLKGRGRGRHLPQAPDLGKSVSKFHF